MYLLTVPVSQYAVLCTGKIFRAAESRSSLTPSGGYFGRVRCEILWQWEDVLSQ